MMHKFVNRKEDKEIVINETCTGKKLNQSLLHALYRLYANLSMLKFR